MSIRFVRGSFSGAQERLAHGAFDLHIIFGGAPFAATGL
jgi:hypothetical protein